MLKVLAIAGLAGLGFLGLSGAAERMMVYPFDSTHVTPADAGVGMLREVRYKSEGETLVLWVAKPKAGKPTILYFHGNAGNLANRAPRFRTFVNRGFGLVAMAYRGSGGSTGTPSQKGIAQDAINVLHSMPELIGDGPVVIYGESLGTGVAVFTPDSEAISDSNFVALVLEAPYTSIPDVARHAYPKLGSAVKMLKNTWSTKDRIARVHQPLLVLHGTKDPLIPIEMGREVFKLSAAIDKTFHAVNGAGHNNVWQPDAVAILDRFLNRF